MILSKNNSDITVSVVVFISAAIWGLYWLPLRKIEQAGVGSSWSVLAVYVVPFLFLLPWAIIRRHALWRNAGPVLLIGLPIGAALACYATGFLHTTVLRTTLLFYMTPIWSTLLAMIFLQEKTGLRRWIAIGTGLFGLCLMLTAKDSATALAAINWGDISALMAGFFLVCGHRVTSKKTGSGQLRCNSSTVSLCNYFQCRFHMAQCKHRGIHRGNQRQCQLSFYNSLVCLATVAGRILRGYFFAITVRLR